MRALGLLVERGARRLRHAAGLALAAGLAAFAVAADSAAQPVLEDVVQFIDDYRPRSVFVRVFDSEDRLPANLIAQGSGVLLESGYVLTSLHLVGDTVDREALYREIGRTLFIDGTVGFGDGVPPARLEYVDHVEAHDLLLLRFDPNLSRNFAFACIRNTQVRTGEEVAILGFPLGGELSATTGRVTRITANAIQTDATAAKGSSGSPVYDADGRLIGVLRGELQQGIEGADIYVVVPISRAGQLLIAVERETEDTCGRAGSAPEQAIMRLEGEAAVSVSGDSGLLLTPQNLVTGLNEPAEAKGSGAEASECDAGDETISRARASAIVSALGANGLQFVTTIVAQGGHYRTAAACVSGRAIGFAGHDTQAIARVRSEGHILFTMPRDGSVRLSWRGFREGTSRLRINGPDVDASVVKELADMGSANDKVIRLAASPPGTFYDLKITVMDEEINRGGCCGVDRTTTAQLTVERLN